MRQLTLGMLLTLFALGLSSCASVKLACLPMREYTVAEQASLVNEVAAATPAVRGLVQDYFQMRQANRACKGVK